MILEGMSKAGLNVKLENSQLVEKEVTFLCHSVSDKGIQPNSDNIAQNPILAYANKSHRSKTDPWDG